MSFPVLVWTMNNQTNEWSYKRRANDVVFNPAALAQFPTKIVADGKSVWMLSGRGNYGYNIYKRPEYKVPEQLGEDAENWKQVFGQVMDLYPGENYVWAVNAEQDIFACKQPCDTGDWIKQSGKARAVAVGPFYSPTEKTTKDKPTRVWAMFPDGTIRSRNETDVNGSYYWMDHTKSWSAIVPKRVRDLLDERHPALDWSDDNKYSFPAWVTN